MIPIVVGANAKVKHLIRGWALSCRARDGRVVVDVRLLFAGVPGVLKELVHHKTFFSCCINQLLMEKRPISEGKVISGESLDKFSSFFPFA